MRIKQRMMGTIVLGSLGVAMAAPVMAEVQPGWYMGISPGQASYDVGSKDDFDDLVIDSFAAAGAPVISGTSSLDDSDTAWSIFGGYRFNTYLAVEAGYVDLGSAEYRSSGTVNPVGPVTSAASTFNMDISSTGFTLAAIGSLPLGEAFDLHARLGIFLSDLEFEIATTVGSASSSGELSASSQEVLTGLGAAWYIGSSWSLSADWVRYNDVGDEDETGEGDIDVLSLALAYRF